MADTVKVLKSELPKQGPLTEGYQRSWLKCPDCGALQYYDYIPGSLSNPIMTTACGHWQPGKLSDYMHSVQVVNDDLCECGDLVSSYERTHYGKCTSCHKKEAAVKAAESLEKAKLDREEAERLNREKLNATKDRWRDLVKKLVGHTITYAEVTDWEDFLKEYHPLKVVIDTLSGEHFQFAYEETSDGCHGCYDYYHSLDMYKYGQPLTTLEMETNQEVAIHLLAKYAIKEEPLSRVERETLILSMEDLITQLNIENKREDRAEYEQQRAADSPATDEGDGVVLPPEA